jgi:Ca-activated chloride channel family protein
MKSLFRFLLGFASLSFLLCLPASATGIMMPKGVDLPPLAIKSHRVKVVLSDQVARTQVEQVFINHTDQQLEATFIFPLPAGASVSEFAMIMNGKRVVGEVLEKERARQIYTDIVRRMKDPGLLEYMGSNLFKASVFPIPARGDQKIDLSYSEVIKVDAGLAEYVFPLKTGEKASSVMDEFSVSLELNTNVPIKTVYSPSHPVEVVKKSDTKALVSFEEPKSRLDKDFRLLYTLSDKDFGLNLVTHRPKGSDGYFLLMIAPKTDLKEDEILPKDVCFVIDTSGSMSGKNIEQAVKALKYCVSSLRPKDRFNIVRFSTDVETFREGLVSAGKAETDSAYPFIEKFAARGGTDINLALETALSLKSKEDRPYIIVFLTDGRPTIGTTETPAILANLTDKNKANTRTFVFGVGHEVNTHLLDQIAGQTRATSQYVGPDEDIEVKVSNLFDKVSAPVLASLKLELGDVGAYDLYPRALPDLFKGTQLLVLGRVRKEGHVALKLTGEINGKPESFVYEGTFPAEQKENGFIANLWANRKVGFLLDEIRLKGEQKELVDEVIALGKEHGIVTPYTSYLVAEDTRPEVAGTPRRPAEKDKLRHGWTGGGPGGETNGEFAAGGEGRKGGKEEEARPAATPGPAAAVNGEGGEATEHAWTGGRAPEPAKKAAEDKYQLAKALKQDSGKEAVDASEQLSEMKDKQVAESQDERKLLTGTAKALGRKFELRDGVWTDTSWKKENEPVKVKYLGDAYFKLLEREPDLKEAFALGEQVLVVLKSGKAVLVTKEGKKDFTDKELDALLMLPPLR